MSRQRAYPTNRTILLEFTHPKARVLADVDHSRRRESSATKAHLNVVAVLLGFPPPTIIQVVRSSFQGTDVRLRPALNRSPWFS